MLVLVTIHGIGFQQAPSKPEASDGYADLLHQHLQAQAPLAGGVLGDDPNRTGAHGPVYVQSVWPPATTHAEAGLSRLGTWKNGTIDHAGAPLAGEGARIAHVALVYSNLEEQKGDAVALFDVVTLGTPALTHYATVGGIVRAALDDLRGLHGRAAAPVQGLTPRDEAEKHRGFISRLLHGGKETKATPSTLHTVEDDVAAYVVRNEHRERVRGFIREAVTRILFRDDVEGVVLNTHSNGTVMGFDLIAALPPQLAPRVRALITAGSPLRKYVDFMDWGIDARNFYWAPTGSTVTGTTETGTPWPSPLRWWTNFVDNADPVADPLQPPADWKLGQEEPPGGGPGLFVVYDPESGAGANVPISDIVVDNVKAGVGGDLPAHNYWDNVQPGQFCSKAADVLSFALTQAGSVNLSGAAAARPAAAAAGDGSSQ